MTEFHEDSIPQLNPKIAARVVDGHAVVVVLDSRKVYRLDPIGSRIWELCDGRSLGAIADQLVAEFEVDREVALADASQFVQQLAGLGALAALAAPGATAEGTQP